MTHLLSAFVLSFISVQALSRGHKIYVEQEGVVPKLIAATFAAIGIVSSIWSYYVGVEFLKYMGWQ